MAIKKSELYATLWASCDELRGGMDASQYTKIWSFWLQFILNILFLIGWVYLRQQNVDSGNSFEKAGKGLSFGKRRTCEDT